MPTIPAPGTFIRAKEVYVPLEVANLHCDQLTLGRVPGLPLTREGLVVLLSCAWQTLRSSSPGWARIARASVAAETTVPPVSSQDRWRGAASARTTKAVMTSALWRANSLGSAYQAPRPRAHHRRLAVAAFRRLVGFSNGPHLILEGKQGSTS